MAGRKNIYFMVPLIWNQEQLKLFYGDLNQKVVENNSVKIAGGERLGEAKEGIGGISGDGQRHDLRWWAHTIMYRLYVVELCAWNLYNIVNQCYPNKVNKKGKKRLLPVMGKLKGKRENFLKWFNVSKFVLEW